MHDEMIKVGGILKAARDAKGMTQATLSKTTGIAVRTIIDIEKDKRHPSHEVLHKIIHALDLSADHVYWPERTPYTPEQEQLIRAVASCNERDKRLLMDIAWAFVRNVNDNENHK
jgi:DNA-binding XRE family transcriptional regulator